MMRILRTLYYFCLACYCFLLSFFIFTLAHGQELDPIGYGGSTTGGRGGTVTYVTNLNDSGAGSLRSCIQTNNTNCIFRVGGEIQLSSELTQIGFNNVSIWGMSAPKPVIITSRNIPISGSEGGRTFQLFNSDNVRYHNLTFIGYENSNYDNALHSQCCDVFSVQGTNPNIPQNILLQNLSVFGGNDETTSFTATSQATFINSVIGLPLSFHGGHFGAANLTGAADPDNTAYSISFLRNFFIGSYRRNPETKVKAQEIINNLVQNSGPSYACSTLRGGGSYTLINNYYRCLGLDSPIEHMANAGVAGISKGPSGSPSFYLKGNVVWGKFPKKQTDIIRFRADSEAPYQENNPNQFVTSSPVGATSSSNILATKDLLNYDNFGNSWRRDSLGQKVPTDDGITTTALSYINNPETNINRIGDFLLPAINTSGSASAYTDADSDGMADEWEKAVGLNPASADHNGTTLSGGSKTNLECFMLANCPQTLNTLYLASANSTGILTTDATDIITPEDIDNVLPESTGISRLTSSEGYKVLVDNDRFFYAQKQNVSTAKNVITCPHRFFDVYTGDICIEMFKESSKIDAVMINTVHRYNCTNAITDDCDVVHAQNNLFHRFVRYFVNNDWNVTQFHGFGTTYNGVGAKAGATLEIIVSAALFEVDITPTRQAQINTIATNLEASYGGGYDVGACFSTSNNLCATTNSINEDLAVGLHPNFTHIEMKRAVRDELCSQDLNGACPTAEATARVNRGKILSGIGL